MIQDRNPARSGTSTGPRPILVPVLELAPTTYATRPRPSPAGSAAENPQGWHDDWTAALADAGIVGLAPFAAGLWLVELAQLHDPQVLRTVLAKQVERARADHWDLDQFGPFCGGLVLSNGGATIAPGCCADLSNLHDWIEAAQSTADSWSMVWIGHPWTHVRATGDTLHFALPAEHSDPDQLRELLQVDRQDLLDALADAQDAIRTFGVRLLPLVAELDPSVPPERVLRILLHGHEDE